MLLLFIQMILNGNIKLISTYTYCHPNLIRRRFMTMEAFVFINSSLLMLFNPIFAFPYLFRPLSIWKITELPAVTHFQGIEEYYQKLRSQYGPRTHPQEWPQPKRKENTKKSICKSVLNSNYFKMYERHSVDVDDEKIRAELKQHHANVFNTIFIRDDTSSSNYVYKNPYVSRATYIKDKIVEEYVFACPVRDSKSRKIEEYFVSREYNVNIVEGGYSIAGRFIFARNDVSQLTLLALAEESGTELLPWPLSNQIIGNLFNLTERYNEDLFATLTENPDLDPVCQLEDGFKLRLCAILFSSGSFKNKIVFRPTASNVVSNCKKKTISIIGRPTVTTFLDEYIRPSWGRIFEEWVIGCQAIKSTTGSVETYYVSRGMWPNSVFMYENAGYKNLSTYNYFYNVSVANE